MPYTDDEIQDAAARTERWLDEVDPATIEWQDASDIREITAIVARLKADEELLLAAVAKARANGQSWTMIALALDVTRQAARQRFADKVSA